MTNILQKFGYTETEARFLELVIPLGGYFVRRQFNQFAACKRESEPRISSRNYSPKDSTWKRSGPGLGA